MKNMIRTLNTMKIYPRGDFSFILEHAAYKGTGYGKNMDKRMFEDAFKAIESVKGGWEFMATDEPDEGGYMFGSSKNMKKRHEIDDAIGKLDTYHSGGSYALTMRNMQYIAKNGWTAFIQLHWPEYTVAEPLS